jgi:phosphoglycerate dehydrogenase-like enzyme
MLTIWSNAPLPPQTESRLTQSLAPNRLLISPQRTAILSAGGPDPLLAQADIAFGQPDPRQILSLAALKWIQLTTAGYTRYDRPDIRETLGQRGTIITSASSVFDEPCAEHALSFILANARALPQAAANQLGPRDWPIDALRTRSRLLTGQSALILGFGAIARRLTELLMPLHMNLSAVRQNPRGNEPIPTHPVSSIDSLLPNADHVINILPSSPSTDNFFTAARFALMKPGAIFYNIGRGTTVDQNALIAALASEKIAAAYLDVTVPEPLPPDNPLWKAPNCFITPHTAGGSADEFDRNVDHFLTNLKLFQTGTPLRDRII